MVSSIWKKSSKHLAGHGDKLEALYLAKEDEQVQERLTMNEVKKSEVP